MKARRMDLVAMGFLIAALVGFLMSQMLVEFRLYDPFLDGEGVWQASRGYEAWATIFGAHRGGYLDNFYWLLIATGSMAALVALTSPLLFEVMVRSRAIWWLLVFLSGMSLAGVMVGLVWLSRQDFGANLIVVELGPAHYCSIVYPGLNFVGLLLVRRRERILSS